MKNKRLQLLLPLLSCLLLICIISSKTFGQEMIKKIKKRGTLIVGMTGTQPPFSMQSKKGELVGFEVDVAKMIASDMQVELKINEMPFAELLPSLQNGTIDMVLSGMTMTTDRNLTVAFVGPYLLSGKSILTNSITLAQAKNVAELDKETVKLVTLKGSTGEAYLKKHLKVAEMRTIGDYDEGVQKVLNNEVTAMVADYPICAYSQMLHKDKTLYTLTNPLTIEPIGLAVNGKDALFLNFLTNFITINTLDGTLTQMEKYWFESSGWVKSVK